MTDTVSKLDLTLRRLRISVLPAVLVVLVLVGMANPAHAHFQLNSNTRIVHVEHVKNGLKVFLHLPMPYLVANLIGPVGENGLPQPAPFTTSTLEDGVPAYYLDGAALQLDPLGLGRLAAQGHRFVSNGQTLQAEVQSLRVYPRTEQPPFATIEEARQSFAGEYAPASYPPTYVGDTVVDVVLIYSSSKTTETYTISSTLDPGLAGQETTANLILDYYPGGVEVFRARGLMADPIHVSRSPWAAALTFVKEGIRHILEGLDHVLFVVCLALGATTFRSLIGRATGFTIGHSVTLSLGFFGFVPTGAWFIPAIELGIAATIIFAALAAVAQRNNRTISERTMFLTTVAIGTLHGLGFSFVLHRILQVDSPNIWQSLLSFNVGVEIGQVLIILVCWPAFYMISKLSSTRRTILQWAIAAPCIAVASIWVVQRTLLLAQSAFPAVS